MRIADVAQFVSPTSGGIRTYLRAKAEWAGRRGVTHSIVVPRGRPGSDRLGTSRVTYVRGHRALPAWGYRLAVRPAPVLEALVRAAPDVVVLHDPLAFPASVMRWARSRDIPVIAFCHSDLRLGGHAVPGALRGPAVNALGRLQRRALAAADAVVVASEATAEAIAGDLDRPPLVSPLGVDTEPFAAAGPDPELRRTFADGTTPLVVHVGRLSADKHVDLLVPTLAGLPGVAMVVAGSGPATRSLRREARRHGVADRLTLLGHVADRHELARLVATADCVLQPNPEEPYGLAALEALAAGTPVVAPRAGGAGEALDGRGATLVAPGDAGALADGVLRALGGPPPPPPQGLEWERTFATEWGLYTQLTGGSVPRTVMNLGQLRAPASPIRAVIGA